MKRKKSKYWTRKYDPLYTWNRGGRLKEIRKRKLARKFFLHWKTKVWGGNLMRVVTPEKADEFRKRSLLKKVRKSQVFLLIFLRLLSHIKQYGGKTTRNGSSISKQKSVTKNIFSGKR